MGNSLNISKKTLVYLYEKILHRRNDHRPLDKSNHDTNYKQLLPTMHHNTSISICSTINFVHLLLGYTHNCLSDNELYSVVCVPPLPDSYHHRIPIFMEAGVPYRHKYTKFQYSIVLSLAIFVSIIGTDLASKDRFVCHVTAFLSHFLCSSVFLSSLSITILVFYSIWIVGIKHQAKKLSPYLIPISWTISGIWALIWLAVGLANDMYIKSNIDGHECTELCQLSTQSRLIYALIVPIVVIICVNLCIFFLNLFRIRQVFKNSDRNEMEIVRLRKVAFGDLLLVPSLGLPFLLWILLSFSPLYIYEEHGLLVTVILIWVDMISTGSIGITHFLLVTYQTPEVRLPKFIRLNRGGKLFTSQTSSSNSRVPRQEPVLKFNVVKKPKIDCIVIENENTETKV